MTTVKMTIGPDGNELCSCGFPLHQMHGVSEPDGFVCADCVTFFDNAGEKIGGPYLPPAPLVAQIEAALSGDSLARHDALFAVSEWLRSLDRPSSQLP